MNRIASGILMHYGTKRHSGRYPWGSGDSPYQHSGDFLSRVNELKKLGLSEKEIAKTLDLSTTDLRMQTRVASHERRELEVDRARSLRQDGKSLNEIAAIMGYKNESSIRSLLNENTSTNKNKARVTADILRSELETKRMIDVGVGVERELGISQNTMEEAIFILRGEGYNLYGVGIPQVTNLGKQINTPVLCAPDIEYKYAYQNMGEIQSINDYHSTDGGNTYDKLEYPASVNGDRVYIRYGDQGGSSKDGVIELRRGVDDLDLGPSHYAQVRILVDGTHYAKGMAMYSDDIPDGADIVFNANKKSGTAKEDVLKKIKDDPDNPFGAYIKADGQSFYIDKEGDRKLSAINKLKEEGDWDEMSRNLSSQFLSKQPVQLINMQLGLTYSDAESELDDITSLTNPTIKKKLLLDFAENCDGAVVHLKAAALPRQKTQVILPITSIKDNEVYAPNFKDGEQVALVRFPHGGTFEIPVLTVNNKNKKAREILGVDIRDAIGITPKVAERLSGADFDGDQVVAIPINDRVRVKSTAPLEGLEGFNAKDLYSYHEGMKVMTKGAVGKEMGGVSNLITDMTLQGATDKELTRAVRHSMVVIDAEKHKLDYKQSEKDNGIAELKKKYQGGDHGGAATLISRHKQTVAVPEQQGSGIIDPITGKVEYKQSGREYDITKTNKKTGEATTKTVAATTKVKLLNETDNLRTLSSGTPQENAYADYGNKMKELASKARKEYVATGNIQYSASAKALYIAEVDGLNAKLNIAAKNAPRERLAQAIANSTVKAKVQANPDMQGKSSEAKALVKKASQQAIYDARNSVGASSKAARIEITDKEWEAIQSGAIAETKLAQILRYSDTDAIRQRAMPRATTQLSDAKVNKIKAMTASGYTNMEIAEALGVSTSTVAKYLND